MPSFAIGGFGAPAVDAFGRTIHPYGYGGLTQPQYSGPTFLSARNAATAPPAPAPGTTIPTSTTNLPTNPGNLAAGLATDVSQSNLAASPYMKQLTDLINETNAAAQKAINEGRFGAAGTQATNQFLTNINAGARGELPQDVINQTLQSGAERGAGFGVDSANTNAAVRRALGLNSLALQNQALGQYGQLASLYPLPELYGMQNQLVSPGTYASAQEAELRRQQEAAQFANDLAFRYYAANLAAATRNQGGGGGRYPVSRGGTGLVTDTPVTGGARVAPTPYAPPAATATPTLPASYAPYMNPYDPLAPVTSGLGMTPIPTFSTTNPSFGPGLPNYNVPTTYGPGAPTITNAGLLPSEDFSWLGDILDEYY